MFECNKTALSEALSAVTAVVKDKHTIPILQNVLLLRQDSALQVSGSNLETEIITRLPADFSPDWQDFTAPIGQFRDFVRSAPADRIRIEPVIHAGKLTSVQVMSGRSKLRINTLPATDYPQLDNGPISQGFTVDGGILKSALSAVAYCISNDKSQVAFHGVLFEASPEGLYLCASDRYRLEQRLIKAMAFDEGALKDWPRITVPKAGVDRILGLIVEDENITIEASDRKLRAVVGKVTMVTKLLEEPFPKYRAFVPSALPILARYSGKAASDAIFRVLLATPDATKGMVFAFDEDGLKLSARDHANGDAEDAIDATVSQPVTMGFNGRLLQDVLKHMEQDSVEMLMEGRQRPAIFRSPGDPENFALLYSVNIPGMPAEASP